MQNPLTAIVISLLAGSFVVGGSSSSKAADPNDVASIVDRMRRASGGDDWASVHTLHVVTGAVSGGKPSTMEHWEDLVSGRYKVSEVKDASVTLSGFDGVTAWHQGRSGIAYTLGDTDSALVASDESFRVARGWWFRDRRPATIAFVGTRSEAGRQFDILDVTPEGGRMFEAWVDRTTHLLARTDEQQAEDRVVTTYDDYRQVHGLVLPFTVRTGDGGDPSFDEVETVRSVDVNPKVDDSIYSVPALPPSDVQLPVGRDSVEVPFQLTSSNRILVPVTLDGRLKVDAEFDSGGSLLLQPASVHKLGIVSGGRLKTGGGGEGSTVSSEGRLSSLELGAAKVSGVSFHSFGFRPEAPDEALIGLEVLQRFVVRFDFDRMVLVLTKPDSFHYVGTGFVVPFHFQDNQPEVKGSIDGVAGLFTIDTGDSGSLLLIAPFARRYGMVDRYQADIPYEGKAVSATHGVWARTRARVVAFDGPDGRTVAEVHDPVTRISLQHSGFDANRNVSANIGIGILSQFNLTFDYPHQRLILEPSHLFGRRDIFSRTGFRLKRDESGWTITAVYPGSPASDANLAVGDRILRVSGRTPATMTEEELGQILKGPVGTSLDVDVATAAASRSLKLLLRDVFCKR